LTAYVLDASVVVKWYLEESLWEQARMLLASQDSLLAPDFILTEAANVFLKKIRSGSMREDIGAHALDEIALVLDRFPSDGLREAAFRLALSHDRSYYDALYAALALREDVKLITADERLINGLRAHYPATMLWLGDVSPLV
jgi:hypothetical protein